MTDTSKDAVERLLDGVTPGPWRLLIRDGDNQETCNLSVCGDVFVLADFNGPQYPHQYANARFIAAARELVPALLAESEALTAEVARLTAALAETEALEEQHGAVIARLTAALAQSRAETQAAPTLQQRATEWAMACFGTEIAADKTERTHRFLEEALELAQSCGCTKGEAGQLVDYVFARDKGYVVAEVGDVLNTVATLCTSHGIDMDDAGHKALDRCWANIEKTRAKRAAKPSFSPLPVAIQPDTSKLALARAALMRWQHYGCPDCGGDCSSANPPIGCCIMQETRAALALITAQEGE